MASPESSIKFNTLDSSAYQSPEKEQEAQNTQEAPRRGDTDALMEELEQAVADGGRDSSVEHIVQKVERPGKESPKADESALAPAWASAVEKVGGVRDPNVEKTDLASRVEELQQRFAELKRESAENDRKRVALEQELVALEQEFGEGGAPEALITDAQSPGQQHLEELPDPALPPHMKRTDDFKGIDPNHVELEDDQLPEPATPPREAATAGAVSQTKHPQETVPNSRQLEGIMTMAEDPFADFTLEGRNTLRATESLIPDTSTQPEVQERVSRARTLWNRLDRGVRGAVLSVFVPLNEEGARVKKEWGRMSTLSRSTAMVGAIIGYFLFRDQGADLGSLFSGADTSLTTADGMKFVPSGQFGSYPSSSDMAEVIQNSPAQSVAAGEPVPITEQAPHASRETPEGVVEEGLVPEARPEPIVDSPEDLSQGVDDNPAFEAPSERKLVQTKFEVGDIGKGKGLAHVSEKALEVNGFVDDHKWDEAQVRHAADALKDEFGKKSVEWLMQHGFPSSDLNYLLPTSKIDYSGILTDPEIMDSIIERTNALTDAQKQNIMNSTSK